MCGKTELIDFLIPIAAGIAKTFGDRCEVVIHDFQDPEHSIVYLAGNVTGRKVGGSVTEIGLAAIKGGDEQEDLISYIHNTKDGKVLRSSTIMLRDPEGHVFGCVCINMDITDILPFQDFVNRLFETSNMQKAPQVHFTDEIEEVLGGIMEEAIEEVGKAGPVMNRQERINFVSSLEKRGAFMVRKAVPTVAEYLNVSRETVYQYLREVRIQNGDGAS